MNSTRKSSKGSALPDSYDFEVSETEVTFWDMDKPDNVVMEPLLRELRALGIDVELAPKVGEQLWNSFPGMTYCG